MITQQTGPGRGEHSVTIDATDESVAPALEEVEAARIDAGNITAVTAEGMKRFYGLAKRQAWDVRQLSWGKIPGVPEGHGSAEKRERRLAMWRSVVTQQLQADMIAAQLSVQLLADASDAEAKLYYSTMAQDEARHYEAWLQLSESVGGACEPDPFLEKLAKLTMEVDTIEEKIWLLQVAYEGLVIPRFHQIANAAPGTILAEICTRLAVDDGIHHGAGVCYEKLLLTRATQKTKRMVEKVTVKMWPMFVEHLLWRPRERAWASAVMHARDQQLVESHRLEVLKMGSDVGIDLDLTY
jgi:hypothetical protein